MQEVLMSWMRKQNVLCFDLFPTSEGLVTYVCEMFYLNLDLELDPLSNIEII